MRITYDSEADAITIYLKEEQIQATRSQEIVPAKVIMSFDEHNNPIDIELLYVSKYIDDPTHANVIDLAQQAITDNNSAATQFMCRKPPLPKNFLGDIKAANLLCA